MTAQPRFPDLDGASVFVTGGGKGIGAALTRAFAAQGARVAFCGRSDRSAFAAEVAAETGADVRYLAADVADAGALGRAMAEAVAAHGPLRVMVNNAADDTRMAADEVTPEQWDQSQAVNLRAYFFGCQHAARLGGQGLSIINYSSISYMMADAGYAPYIAANAGITGLTRTLAREWGHRGIRVNAIAPGWVMTERQRALWANPEAVARHIDKQCLKAEIEPEDMAGGTLFLASEASRMVTGQVLVIDGGVVHSG